MRTTNPEAAEKALKARCRTDRRLFARYFFHERLEYAFHRAHRSFLDRPKRAFRERPPMSGWRRAWMLPRGNGKTTICIRIEVCHDIVYFIEDYIVILAESASLSRARVYEVSVELTQNKRLRKFFGELRGEGIWRAKAGEIEASTGTTILAKSMEAQVRGLLHPVTNARPSKIILDDAEDSQDVLNPDLRERDQRRFREDIEGAAAVDGRTNFQVTGTPLHREALLPRLRENPAWEFNAFPAIARWPARMDLWDRCRAIWASASGAEFDEDGRPLPSKAANEIAWRFYQAHRREMDRGARVLWPEGEPLFALMVFRWANGEAAFSKEKLLVPRDPSLATFEMDSEQYPVRGALRHSLDQDEFGPHLVVDTRLGKTRRIYLDKLDFVTFHDPAKADPSAGKTRRSLGDYACITVMGIESMPGGGRVGHIVAAWIERENAPPSVQVETHFDLCERWKVGKAILESDTLGLLRKAYRDEARRRAQANLFHQIPLRSLERQTTNKDARIATMEPAVTNGWITFNRTLSAVYWNQWVDHPTGDHDDGPDSAEGCWRYGSRKSAGLRAVNLGQ